MLLPSKIYDPDINEDTPPELKALREALFVKTSELLLERALAAGADGNTESKQLEMKKFPSRPRTLR